MITHYHANVHVPGYLPEEGNYRFDTMQAAWAFLVEEIDRDWDIEYECAGADKAERLGIDGRYLHPHTYMHNNNGYTGSVHLSGPTETHLGWIYEVTECGEEDCEEED